MSMSRQFRQPSTNLPLVPSGKTFRLVAAGTVAKGLVRQELLHPEAEATKSFHD